ncbi:Sodium-dependent multivitamin transporter [Nymphon striatum]|nr:Sodium-dependent multivitamin transporter [Nymphon striatum]
MCFKLLSKISFCCFSRRPIFLKECWWHGGQFITKYLLPIDYLGLRFNNIVRLIASSIYAIQMFTYMSIVLYAPALALSHASIENLKLKPFKKITGQKLTKGVIEKRMQRSPILLRRLTVSKVQVKLFTDEKIFAIEPPINKQNDRVYGNRTVSMDVSIDHWNSLYILYINCK